MDNGKSFLKILSKAREEALTNAYACVIIVKIIQRIEMYFTKQVEKLRNAEYRNGAANIVLGGARFSVFQKALKFSKED